MIPPAATTTPRAPRAQASGAHAAGKPVASATRAKVTRSREFSLAKSRRDRERWQGPVETRATCGWLPCGRAFAYVRHIGRKRRYCSPACAADAHEYQRLTNF